MQVRTHAQKYFQKLSTMVILPIPCDTQNSRSSQSFSKRRVRETITRVKYEEPEKTESSESSTTLSPKSDSTMNAENEKRLRKTGKSAPHSSEGAVDSRPIAVVSRAPVPELNYAEVDLICNSFSQYGWEGVVMDSSSPYRSLSPFEQEVGTVHKHHV